MKRHPAMRRFCVLGLAILLGTAAARADVIWTGAGADNLASTAANWSGGVAPAANDAVVLDATTDKAMTWDLDIPLASWTQDGYTGTVTIATINGSTGFTNLVVTGNVVLGSGKWIHTANPSTVTPTYRLRATIGGILTIGPEAVISADGLGYSPGYGLQAPSHGGQGYDRMADNCGGPPYGSVYNPVTWGSGGVSLAGGGVVQLTVIGTVTNNGQVTAAGQGGPSYAGSGGSVNIRAGCLTGTGVINADAGIATGSAYGPAGGGRVAVTLTESGAGFTGYTNRISAYGTKKSKNLSGGAGTVYLRAGGEGETEGTLIVDNNNPPIKGATPLNDVIEGERFGHVVVRNGGRLVIETGKQVVVTGSWTNGATVEAAGSLVAFAGSGASLIAGDTAFAGLKCAAAG